MVANTPNDIPVYTYLASTGYGTPYLGTNHASDVVWQYELSFGPSHVYNGYFITFANTGDVNGNYSKLPQWEPRSANNFMSLHIKLDALSLIPDTYRSGGMELLYSNPSLRL